ncbi:MAG: hypothetical protein IPK65_09220 [Gammaproteobacteria bacterium]|nr:hypothetical protein [Gammaproteobacteria bacterium]
MRYPSIYSHPFILALVLLCAGCSGEGGIGGGSAATATGVLKDANVSGLSYRSGEEEGETGVDGSFSYEVGRDVTFSIGELIVGTAPGQDVITPIDFVQAGGVNSAAVINIVRFLLWLDEDAVPANGIEISEELREHAEVTPSIWNPVSFNVSEGVFNSELDLLFFDMNIFRGPRSLPTATEARNHMTATLQCLRSGAFRGTLVGDDSGDFGVMIDAATGELRGFATRNLSQTLIGLEGTSPVSLDQQAFFISGDTNPNTTFMGRMLDADSVTGAWQIAAAQQIDGTFQGERIGGDDAAVYRFTATYEGADSGIYTFDINAAGNVTGVAYSVEGDVLTTLSGTLDGNVSITAETGNQLDIVADVGLAAGTLNGFDTQGNTITGSGCRLN